MKTALLLVLTFSGLTAMAADVLREYHYVSLNKTWTEAQSYCRENFSDLATVSDKDENNRLRGVLPSSGNYAWLGLYDDLTNWAWTPGNISYNYNKNFSRWESGQPDRRICNRDCIAMSKGHWLDFHCTKKIHAVCYYEQGPSRYILVKTKMDWYDAVNYCRSKFTGLVTVRNMSENNHISSLLSETTWIGLYRICWAKWSDGSRRTIHNWNKGQTYNAGANMTSCAAVKTDTGKWWNVDCGERHNFICQKVINPPSSAPGVQHRARFKLKFQSEADLTDPAIQQQLLEQLHAKLEKHGLSDFKLRWVQTDGQTFHKEQKTKKEEGCGG